MMSPSLVKKSPAAVKSLQRNLRERYLTPNNNRLSRKSLRDLSPQDFEGTRIAVMEAYDFLDEGSLDSVGSSVGREVFLEPWAYEDGTVEEGVYCLTSNFNDYTVPVWIDYESREASLYFYEVDYYEVAHKVGRVLYDTIRSVYVLPEAFLFDDTGEEWPDCISGLIYDDGTIAFEGGFLYYTEEIYSEISYPYHNVMSSDTVWSVSPVYNNMLLLQPNGYHSFNRTMQTMTIPDDDYGNLSHLTEELVVFGRSNGVVGPCGNGGSVGTPIDPRPIKPGTLWEGIELPVYKSGGQKGGRAGTPVGTFKGLAPVYMYQADDSTLIVYNLYGEGLVENFMLLHEDGTMSFPGQQIGFDDETLVGIFNCSQEEESGECVWGNEGLVTPDSITWGLTLPYTENGLMGYNYENNMLYFTNGSQFVVPEPHVPFILGDVNRDGHVSIKDVTMLIDHLLVAVPDDSDGFDIVAADMNQDYALSIADVTLLIDLLLTSD